MKETNQINKNSQKVINDNIKTKNIDNNFNKKFRIGNNKTKFIKDNKKNEDINIKQRFFYNYDYVTNKVNDKIKKENKEVEKPVILFDSNTKSRNNINEFEFEKDKDKEDKEEIRDTKYYLNKENKKYRSFCGSLPKVNDNSIKINNDEQEKILKKIKGIDYIMNFQIEKNEFFTKNKINKNVANKIENNRIINENEIIIEAKRKINEIKFFNNNEIQIKNIGIKKNENNNNQNNIIQINNNQNNNIQNIYYQNNNIQNNNIQNYNIQNNNNQIINNKNINIQNINYQNINNQNIKYQNNYIQNFNNQKNNIQNIYNQNFNYQNINYQNNNIQNINYQNNNIKNNNIQNKNIQNINIQNNNIKNIYNQNINYQNSNNQNNNIKNNNNQNKNIQNNNIQNKNIQNINIQNNNIKNIYNQNINYQNINNQNNNIKNNNNQNINIQNSNIQNINIQNNNIKTDKIQNNNVKNINYQNNNIQNNNYQNNNIQNLNIKNNNNQIINIKNINNQNINIQNNNIPNNNINNNNYQNINNNNIQNNNYQNNNIQNNNYQNNNNQNNNFQNNNNQNINNQNKNIQNINNQNNNIQNNNIQNNNFQNINNQNINNQSNNQNNDNKNNNIQNNNIQNINNQNNNIQNINNQNNNIKNNNNQNNNIQNNNNNNLNMNKNIFNNEVKNESLPDNNKSKNNENNLNKNVNKINENFRVELQHKKIENNENISHNISTSPNYFLILQRINIFNSVLIIFNNVSFVIDYFSSNIDNIIQNHKLNNSYCLTKIAYYINKYLWKTDGYLNISMNLIIEKYQDYITRFSEFNNINISLAEYYCYEARNARKIYISIYEMINNELTEVNGPKMNKSYNNYDPKLSRCLNDINKTCNSILSENFMGLFRYQTYCDYCLQRVKSYGFPYRYEYDYQAFYEITFNLSEINYFYKSKNSLNEKGNINLNQCFEYTFKKRNKKTLIEYCNSCYSNRSKSRYNLIYSPPNILTLILTNNEYNENCNFFFQDELNIKNYVLNSKNDRIYYLISCLCRLINTGNFICYCFNPKDSCWYSYSDENINKVEEIDDYAVPLILFYQSIGTMSFEYKKIMIMNELNEINLTVKFNIEIQPINISFNKENRIKRLIEKILSTINLQGVECKLYINGKFANEFKKLSTYLKENNNNNVELNFC